MWLSPIPVFPDLHLDLLFIIDNLHEKKVSFVSLKESIDTATPHGKLMLIIFVDISQFEHKYIIQRQSEGLAIAKGCKPITKTEDCDSVIMLYKAGKSSAT